MPEVKTKKYSSSKTVAPSKRMLGQSEHDNALGLIGRMLKYEAAATEHGINFTAGRFSMLTASEREFYHAELIADYVRLCAVRVEQDASHFDSAIAKFCLRICEMQTPSRELVGTFLAVADLRSKGEGTKRGIPIGGTAREVIMLVLQGCSQILANNTPKPEAVAS